jgi:phospholipid/cholesterol/gamma-HCH transport system substrate-binding protein
MPAAKKVKWDELRAGVMAIAAMAILGVLIFLFTGTGGFFERSATLHTFVSDAAAMAVGAPVRLNGIIVGDVAGVELSGLTDPRKVVRIDLSVYSRTVVSSRRWIPPNSMKSCSPATT